MTGIVFVPPFVLVAVLLLLCICSQIANDGPQCHAAPRWVPEPPANQHPCWASYSRETLLQRAREASREMTLARRELALVDHFDWSAWQVPEPIPVEYLPRRELVSVG